MKSGKTKPLLVVVGNYIRIKKKKTMCMQRHMKQLCPYCFEYVGCKLYKRYFKAWINLQKAFKKRVAKRASNYV